MLNAKELFENLGYIQEISQNQDIVYIKNDPETEMNRIGRMKIKKIIFVWNTKEIKIVEHYKFSNTIQFQPSQVYVLNLDEILSMEKQVHELSW